MGATVLALIMSQPNISGQAIVINCSLQSYDSRGNDERQPPSFEYGFVVCKIQIGSAMINVDYGRETTVWHVLIMIGEQSLKR